MTTFDAPIDIPLVLGRLAPLAEYHWKANGWGTYSDIGEWRSPDIDKPTEAEVYAEWDLYLKEQTQQRTMHQTHWQALLEMAHGTENIPINQLSNEQLQALLLCLLANSHAIATDGTVKPLDLWLHGQL
jgi:hypothetical protein